MKNKKKRKYLNKKLRLNLLFILFLFYATSGHAQTSYFETSSPEAQGMSSLNILKFIERLEAEIDAAHSFMIIRHGKLVSQGWWDPYQATSSHNMMSLSKSFVSTAVGFAVQEQRISLDDLVISFFPDRVPDTLSWQLKEMRIRDLLTMNTGHRSEPLPFRKIKSGYEEITSDWIKYFLSHEVEFMPGTHFLYNSMASYMLSAIIQKVTGEKLVDYLDSRFFQPLEIIKPEWKSGPMGINIGGWGLSITTEDIAKLGQFYLQKGQWEGKQLLSENWIELATSKQASSGSNPNNDWAQGYGFQFWRSRHDSFRADGTFGQFCLVLPQYNLVIATTAGVYNMGQIMNIAWETLLPGLQEIALPNDTKNYQILNNKLDALQLPKISGNKGSSVYGKKSSAYLLNENPLGANRIKLNLKGVNHSIEITYDDKKQMIRIGSDKYLKNMLLLKPPFTEGLDYLDGQALNIAANGAWISPKQYLLRIYFYESTASVDYIFNFEGNEFFWETKFNHIGYTSKKGVFPITGQKVEQH